MKKILGFFMVLFLSLTIIACDFNGDPDPDPNDEMTDLQKVEDAISRVSFRDMDAYRDASINLPTSLIHGVTVSWASSDTTVITDQGTVFRPHHDVGNVDVTLTGTFTFNDETVIEEYVFTVIARPESDAISDFNLLYDDQDLELGDVVTVEGIVSVSFFGGYFLYDGTQHVAVYNFYDGATIFNVGDFVEVKGQWSQYHSLYQIGNIDYEIKIAEGYTVDIEPIDSSISGLYELDSSDVTIHGQPYRITGTPEELFISPHDELILSDGDDFIIIYFASFISSKEAIEAYIGQDVLIELVVHYYADHRNGVLAVFQGGPDDITVIELDDEIKVTQAVNEVQGQFSGATIIADDPQNVTLPSVGLHDVNFTNWASSHPQYIGNDGVIVAMPEENTEVTFTATASLGDETQPVTVTVLLLVDLLDVASTLLLDVGTPVVLEGVVTSYPVYSGTTGFFIQDSDGTAIYIEDDLDVSIGDKVRISGTIGAYTSFGNNRKEIQSAELISIVDSDQPVFVIDNVTANDVAITFPDNHAVRYRLEDLEVVDIAYNQFYFETNDILIVFDYRDYGQHLVGELEIGDILPWMEFTVFELSYGDLVVEGVVLPNLSEVEIEALAQGELEPVSSTIFDLTLPTEWILMGVDYANPPTYTVEWDSDKPQYLDDEGNVTRPDIGELDEVVTLTATFHYDETTTFTFVYTVTVLAQVEGGDDPLVEDFETRPDLPTDGYGDASYVGSHGVQWTFVHARAEVGESFGTPYDYSIDGKGVMLRRGDEPSSITGEFTGGMTSFSFDTRKAFTGNAQRDLRVTITWGVDEELVFEYGAGDLDFGSGADTTVININEIGLNVTGDFTVVIEVITTGNRQITIDNFTWVPNA